DRASAGDALIRYERCAEAVGRARQVAELMPEEPEVWGLLALLLLTEARRGARTGPDGSLVLLADQDRGRWDRALLAEGAGLVRACLRRNRPGPYQIQAAISAVHSDAPTAAQTDWGQILALYDQLMTMAPTPVVALNRGVAVAELRGPAEALAIVDRLDLDGYHLFHSTRADLLRRLGQRDEARAASAAAIPLPPTRAEHSSPRRRRDGLCPEGSPARSRSTRLAGPRPPPQRGDERARGAVREAALPHPDAVGEVIEQTRGRVRGGRQRRLAFPPVEHRRHEQRRRQRQPQPGDRGGGGHRPRPPGAGHPPARPPPRPRAGRAGGGWRWAGGAGRRASGAAAARVTAAPVPGRPAAAAAQASALHPDMEHAGTAPGWRSSSGAADVP